MCLQQTRFCLIFPFSCVPYCTQDLRSRDRHYLSLVHPEASLASYSSLFCNNTTFQRMNLYIWWRNSSSARADMKCHLCNLAMCTSISTWAGLQCAIHRLLPVMRSTEHFSPTVPTFAPYVAARGAAVYTGRILTSQRKLSTVGICPDCCSLH